MGPLSGPAQVSGDELGRQSRDHRAMREPGLVTPEPQFLMRFGSGMPWNDHQYVAGGQADADFGQRGN